MQKATLDEWLTDLASAEPAPGGGAAAAVNAAIGAALVSMVCRLTIGRPAADHEEADRERADREKTMSAVLAQAERLRGEALELAAADADAFATVSRAYRLAKATDEERAERTRAIQAALVDAAAVPLQVLAVAADIIGLAEHARPGANPNVISDLAVAAASARSAGESAAVNVEVNLAALHNPDRRAALTAELERLRPELERAAGIIADVRDRIVA